MLYDCENKTVDFIKNQKNRVSSIDEFLKLNNKIVWLVTVPTNDIQPKHGNSMIAEWHVDDCYNSYGNKITSDDEIDTKIYTPHKLKFKIKNDVKYRYLLSLNDYNVIDINDKLTYHAIFYDKESAEIYRVWLLMTFDRFDIYDLIDQRIVNCRLVDWDNFIKFGLEHTGNIIE